MQLPLSLSTAGEVELNMWGSASVSKVFGTIEGQTEEIRLCVAMETLMETTSLISMLLGPAME